MTDFITPLHHAVRALLCFARRHPLIACGAILTLLFIPWLGLTPFNTKGEPREAIVALSMLKSGNWILPVSLGEDIPYKPPFLAWCIALFSLPGGEVTEFTSRLPSALAAIALCIATASMMRRSGYSGGTALIASLVLATSIEVWRAASACRVDMVLTLFIAGAMFLLYIYVERGCRKLPWGAILCMTLAVLTKGPVGILLPCLVAGIFGLLRGYKFTFLLGRLSAAAGLSLLLPALWYAAAYSQGGNEFIDLALEENFGRFLGKMSYSSHEKPVWYNFATLSSGLLPYTLFLLFTIPSAITALRRRSLAERWRTLTPWQLYSALAAITVFVFYCIPKSKRSVYLLPIYPFAAYFITLLLLKLSQPQRLFALIMASLALAMPIALWSFTAFGSPLMNLIPEKSVSSAAALAGSTTSLPAVVCLAACVLAGLCGWYLISHHDRLREIALMLPVCTLLLTLSAAILPPMLTAKSDREIATEVGRIVPEGTVYQFVAEPMLRFYTVNFYLGDRMNLFETNLPERGWLLVGDNDIETWRATYSADYRANTVTIWDKPSCDTSGRPMLLRFTRK